MERPDDSLQINTSGDFVFDLTRDKINTQTPARNTTLDDLEYSVDGPTHDYILAELEQDKNFNQEKIIPNVSAPITIQRQEDKKNSRKAIFQKYKQKKDNKKDVMQLYDDVMRRNNPLVAGAVIMSDSTKNHMSTATQLEQVEAIPNNQTNFNKMTPPPNLSKKNSTGQSPKPADSILNSGIQHRNSNISMGGSFTINENFSMIIDSNNQFAHSRQSKQIAELLDADIFGSFQQDQRSLIQVDVNENPNHNMNILDLQDIRISAIGRKDTNDQNIFVSGIGLADSQEINIFKKIKEQQSQQYQNQKIKYQDPSLVTKLPPATSNQLQIPVSERKEFEQVKHQLQSQLQHQPIAQIPPNIGIMQLPKQDSQFQKPTATVEAIRMSSVTDIQFPQPNLQYKPQLVPQLESSNSQLSIHSNFQIKDNNSNLLNSGSLAKALGKLSRHVFCQAALENRMPQLLQQCWRLNSTSINIQSATLSLDSIRHKQIIRSLVFEELMAAQTLQKYKQELQSRQVKEKKMFSNFNVTLYLQGQWYEANKIRSNEAIRPKQPHPKRPIDYSMIRETLKNSVEVLKYFQSFIEQFKIEPTEDFKRKYIEFRTSLFQIFNNLKKISQDLYMRSITLHLPEHYYRFYEYIKNSPFLSSSKSSPAQLQNKIEQRQKILLQIQYFKHEHDPLACSDAARDIQEKAKRQLNLLKSVYHNAKRAAHRS